MGMDPDAKLAWGVDLGSEEDGWNIGDRWVEVLNGDDEDSDGEYEDFEELILKIAGFDTPKPPGDFQTNVEGYREYWKALRDFKDNHVFVQTEMYCSYDYSGYLLTVGDVQSVEWTFTPVKDSILSRPDGAALAQFNAVLDKIEYTGDRELKLMLAAFYG